MQQWSVMLGEDIYVGNNYIFFCHLPMTVSASMVS